MNFAPTNIAEILLVEEDAEESRLITEAFASAKARNKVSVVRDGNDALAYLRREKNYAEAKRPDLILLDLNLPGKDGYEVLAEMKADANLRRIPVLALTSSESHEDILKAYHLSVNSYILKPTTHAQLLQMVRGIEEFWLTVVRLPRE